jgi:intraflagellar transport protein 122
MGEHGWVDMLTDVGRKLDRAESEGIARVAFYLRQNGQLQYAREVFTIYAPIYLDISNGM